MSKILIVALSLFAFSTVTLAPDTPRGPDRRSRSPKDPKAQDRFDQDLITTTFVLVRDYGLSEPANLLKMARAERAEEERRVTPQAGNLYDTVHLQSPSVRWYAAQLLLLDRFGEYLKTSPSPEDVLEFVKCAVDRPSMFLTGGPPEHADRTAYSQKIRRAVVDGIAYNREHTSETPSDRVEALALAVRHLDFFKSSHEIKSWLDAYEKKFAKPKTELVQDFLSGDSSDPGRHLALFAPALSAKQTVDVASKLVTDTKVKYPDSDFDRLMSRYSEAFEVAGQVDPQGAEAIRRQGRGAISRLLSRESKSCLDAAAQLMKKSLSPKQ